MQTLTAQYQIVTPMFIGGAHAEDNPAEDNPAEDNPAEDNPAEDNPEIRPPAIKGALRFWWRALHWGECLREADHHVDQALRDLYQKEAALFGAAAVYKDNAVRYGQGVFLLKLKDVHTSVIEKNWPENNDGGSGFLGYGLDKTKSRNQHRKCISRGTFTLELVLKSHITEIQIKQLKKTLLLWGLLGGLGSRSRRGFGSVAITRLDTQTFNFKNNDDYFRVIKTQLENFRTVQEMPPFTALNKAVQIRLAGSNIDYQVLMNQLGDGYRQARKEAGKGLKKLPFGLPLAGNKGESDEEHRRASPLLMHIHAIGQKYLAVISFVPAVFHPDYPAGNNVEFYQPVNHYLQTMECIYP